eukprot:1196134-Prorocentrum_minimum.AAC.2
MCTDEYVTRLRGVVLHTHVACWCRLFGFWLLQRHRGGGARARARRAVQPYGRGRRTLRLEQRRAGIRRGQPGGLRPAASGAALQPPDQDDRARGQQAHAAAEHRKGAIRMIVSTQAPKPVLGCSPALNTDWSVVRIYLRFLRLIGTRMLARFI